MKKQYKQSNIVLHVWLLTPDDTCVALALSSFTFGTGADFDPKWGTEWFKNLCLIWQIKIPFQWECAGSLFMQWCLGANYIFFFFFPQHHAGLIVMCVLTVLLW